MTKIKMNDPSEPNPMVVPSPTGEVNVIDARGRVITIKKPPFLAQFTLMKALGPENSSNRIYYNSVFPLTAVKAIDGNPVPTLTSDAVVTALLQQLDEDGYDALCKGIEQLKPQAAISDDDLKNS